MMIQISERDWVRADLIRTLKIEYCLNHDEPNRDRRVRVEIEDGEPIFSDCMTFEEAQDMANSIGEGTWGNW